MKQVINAVLISALALISASVFADQTATTDQATQDQNAAAQTQDQTNQPAADQNGQTTDQTAETNQAAPANQISGY
jgi:cytochrome oxidase Cu insertion factor (SCO1/SenC/PrrC family)